MKKLEKTKEEIAAGAQKKLKNVMQRKRMLSQSGMEGAMVAVDPQGIDPADRPPMGPGPRQSGSFRTVAAMVEARNQPKPPFAEPTMSSPRIEKTLSMNQGNPVVSRRCVSRQEKVNIRIRSADPSASPQRRPDSKNAPPRSVRELIILNFALNFLSLLQLSSL